MTAWHPYKAGSTIGTPGTERGVTLCDDEHRDGARITLEHVPERAPDLYAITCGAYGEFVHTAFLRAETPDHAVRDHERMRDELAAILGLLADREEDWHEELDDDPALNAIADFCDRW